MGGDSGPKSSASKRRGVTVLSDDGRYEWGELTRGEKVARATQQSVNFVVVLAGAVLTVSFEGFFAILRGFVIDLWSSIDWCLHTALFRGPLPE